MPDPATMVPMPVATEPRGQRCDWCDGPIDVENRKRIRTRRFCRSLCRVRWHEDRKKKRLARIDAAVQELSQAVRELVHK